jgi:hypothetical protein
VSIANIRPILFMSLSLSGTDAQLARKIWGEFALA